MRRKPPRPPIVATAMHEDDNERRKAIGDVLAAMSGPIHEALSWMPVNARFGVSE